MVLKQNMIKVTVNFNFKFMILIDAKGRSYDLSFTRCIWLVIFVDAKSDARVAGQLVPQLPAHPTVSLVAASTGKCLPQISHNVQNAHECWCNKKVIVWLCVCTGDNLLAKAHGLSSRTYAQTVQ